MGTTSARRVPNRQSPSFPLGWLAIAAGAALVAYALWVELLAPVAWRGFLEPAGKNGSAAVYETPEIALEPGTWGIRLSIRPRRGLVTVVVGGARATVTAPGLPGWEASGRLRAVRRSGSAVRRRARLAGTVVARVPRSVRTALRLEVEQAADAPASVKVVRLRGDFRLPLYAGIALLVAGIALQPGFRERLLPSITGR